MPIRKLLLMIMLAALALAAAAGAGAILFSSANGVWRIEVSAVLTAAAVALMIPLTFLIDHKRWRATGLTGMSCVLVTFLAGLAAIWLPDYSYSSSSYRYEQALFATPWILLYHGLFLTLGVAWLQGIGTRYAGFTLAGVAGVSTLLTLSAIWASVFSPAYGDREFVWIGLLALDVFGSTATASLMRWGGLERARWTLVGLGASILGFAATAAVVAMSVSNPSPVDFEQAFMEPIFIPLAMLAAGIGFANIACMGTLIGAQRWIRVATITPATCTAVLLAVAALTEAYGRHNSSREELLFRGAGASFLVAGCGSLALVVTTRLNRKINADDRNTASGLVEVHLICPRCQSAQTLAIGKNNCSACGLRINLDIEEPRCPKCEYLLYRLTSNRCPECGTEVAGMHTLPGAPAGAPPVQAAS